MTDIEDRGRRNNVRLVGLPEGTEGTNAASFLRVNLSKWIPSLRGRDIEIDRSHRVYDGGRGSDRPRTLIFRVLRWHDRSEILKGARQAYPVKCAQDNVTLLFFPDFSPATAIRRKAFNPVLKKMTALGLQPFLIYPAVIKLRHKGEQKRHVLRWSGSVTNITIFCCSVRPMFSVMCSLNCSLFMVVSCSCFYVIFIFYNRHLYFYLFYLISKGIFHLGGLVSKMHISVYMLFTEWRCFCFFSFIEYNLGITNIQCTFWRYYATTTFWRYYGSHLSWVENCSQESYSLAGGQL